MRLQKLRASMDCQSSTLKWYDNRGESVLLCLLRLFFFSRAALVAENLFLRKQLVLFQERKATPHQRTTRTYRLAMVALGRFFDWRGALVIIKPATYLK